jgi:ABC-type phosphate/phosphonate transport system substrate-binding protein
MFSIGYDLCCISSHRPSSYPFTAHRGVDAGVAQQITEAFSSMHYQDPLGKEVLDAEHCQAFVAGITTGWEALERALKEPPR